MSNTIYDFIKSLAKDAEPGYINLMNSIAGFYVDDDYLTNDQRKRVRVTAGYQNKPLPDAFEAFAEKCRAIEKGKQPAGSEYFDGSHAVSTFNNGAIEFCRDTMAIGNNKPLDVFDEAIARDLARSQIDTNAILSELLGAVSIACAIASEKLAGVAE